MPDVLRKYSPEETARRRDRFIEKSVAPVAAKMLKAHPRLESAVLMVGQFWADEANDAVHGTLLYSISQTPDLDAYVRDSERYSSEHGDSDIPNDERDQFFEFDSAFVEGRRAADALGLKWQDKKHLEFMERSWVQDWDSNGEAISLFAAYCTESAHQEMTTAEAYSPFCLFVRGKGPSGLEVRMIGKQIRPWLDGVAPELDEG